MWAVITFQYDQSYVKEINWNNNCFTLFLFLFYFKNTKAHFSKKQIEQFYTITTDFILLKSER